MKIQYIGEICRTIYYKLQEHQEALANRTDSYVVLKHWEKEPGEGQSLPEYVVALHRSNKASLHRQIWEALEMASISPENCKTARQSGG